jgi:hypothetical protein
MKKELLVKLLEVSPKTVYNYEKENRKIIQLLKLYFSDNDIVEFLETGKISKCEKLINIQTEATNLEKYLIDFAYYQAKPKLKEIFGGNPFGPTKLYTKGAKEILIDVLKKISPNDISFTLENVKDRLLDRINEEELKWLAFKNPAKKELLSSQIKEYFSNAEILAMVKRNGEIIEFLKKI